MGIAQSTGLEYDSTKWEKVNSNVLYDTLRNKQTGYSAQQYHFIERCDDHKNDIELYEKRIKRSRNTVKVLGANLYNSGYGFCSSQTQANVITEPIVVLAYYFGQLRQNYYNIVLYNSLKGFYYAQPTPGVRYITYKMIGLNPLGETKVWINDNFGMNHPLHEKDPNNDKYPAGDRGIIMNVLDVLKPHFSTGYYRASFFGKVAGCNTIKEAMDFIKVNGGTSTQALEKNKIGLPQKVITLKSSAPPPQVTLPLTTSITQPINTHGQNSFRVNNPPFEYTQSILRPNTVMTTSLPAQTGSTIIRTRTGSPRISFNSPIY